MRARLRADMRGSSIWASESEKGVHSRLGEPAVGRGVEGEALSPRANRQGVRKKKDSLSPERSASDVTPIAWVLTTSALRALASHPSHLSITFESAHARSSALAVQSMSSAVSFMWKKLLGDLGP